MDFHIWHLTCDNDTYSLVLSYIYKHCHFIDGGTVNQYETCATCLKAIILKTPHLHTADAIGVVIWVKKTTQNGVVTWWDSSNGVRLREVVECIIQKRPCSLSLFERNFTARKHEFKYCALSYKTRLSLLCAICSCQNVASKSTTAGHKGQTGMRF